MEFPQYRKTWNNNSFYKIVSFSEFQEIQRIGKRFFLHQIVAVKYFEKIRIREMLEVSIDLYQMSSKKEFERQEESASIYLHK